MHTNPLRTSLVTSFLVACCASAVFFAVVDNGQLHLNSMAVLEKEVRNFLGMIAPGIVVLDPTTTESSEDSSGKETLLCCFSTMPPFFCCGSTYAHGSLL